MRNRDGSLRHRACHQSHAADCRTASRADGPLSVRNSTPVPPNQFTDTFTLPAGTTAPYTLHIVNGNADGTKRISSARVTLNGTEIAGPSDFGQNVAVIDRTVALQATNTLEVRLTSAPGSLLTISVLDTQGD